MLSLIGSWIELVRSNPIFIDIDFLGKEPGGGRGALSDGRGTPASIKSTTVSHST